MPDKGLLGIQALDKQGDSLADHIGIVFVDSRQGPGSRSRVVGIFIIHVGFEGIFCPHGIRTDLAQGKKRSVTDSLIVVAAALNGEIDGIFCGGPNMAEGKEKFATNFHLLFLLVSLHQGGNCRCCRRTQLLKQVGCPFPHFFVFE